MTELIQIFAVILLSSYLLTGLVRLVSKKIGFVNNPDGLRWNQRVVALGGGVAIFAAISIAFFWKGNSVLLSIYPAFFAMFALGFYDDVWGTSPSAKLIVQVACAAFVVSKGFVAPFPWASLGIALTVIWIVGMTNSLNLIDNMDGLASGCTAIAALGMAVVLNSGAAAFPGEVMILTAVSAASLGFLLHNFNPARIFMGDAGSLPLGFILALLSTRMRFTRSDVAPIFSLILILLILIVPLLDTFLVIVARRRANRSIAVGGRDHTSHRLVALGLSEKKAVSVLYLFGIFGAVAAYLALPSSLTGVLTIFLSSIAGSILFAIFLLEIAVYPPVKGAEKRLREPFPIHIQVLIEIALDVCAVTACWMAAHLIRFHDSGLIYYKEMSVIPFLPFVITSKLVALLVFKLYRGIWRSISSRDIYQLFKAAVLGSLFLSLGLLFFTRLVNISRVVLIVDGLLCFLALVGTRSALIAFRRWIRRIASKQSRAVYLGEEALLPWVKEVIRGERGLELKGSITADVVHDLDLLEKFIKEQEIDVIVTTSNAEPSLVEKIISKGLIVRRINMQLV